MRRTRGLSLPELLIVMILLVLLGGILLSMVIAGNGTFVATTSRIGVRQDLQTALRRIVGELRTSNGSYVTIRTSAPKALAFLSARDATGRFVTDANGNPAWQRYAIYYLPAGGTGLRRRYVGATTPAAMTDAQLLALCDGTGDVVGAQVTDLAVTPAGNAVVLRLDGANAAASERASLTFTVDLRN